MADFLRLIDVNAGGLWLKKGHGILHLTSPRWPESNILQDLYVARQAVQRAIGAFLKSYGGNQVQKATR